MSDVCTKSLAGKAVCLGLNYLSMGPLAKWDCGSGRRENSGCI